MTGVGLVFSATSGKVAALCFVLTILIYLQWNELELCAKQRQEKKKKRVIVALWNSLVHYTQLQRDCKQNFYFELNCLGWF